MTWKTPITLLVLLVLLMGAAFYGWKTIISPVTDDKAGGKGNQPTCQQVQQFQRGQLIRSKDVVVNVYNAGTVANLASETLDDLETRGFKAGVFDNAPSNVSASNVTIVTPTKTAPQVRLVASQFKGLVKYQTGPSIDPGISVVVGDDYKGINKKAKRSLRLKRDVSTCTSVGNTSGNAAGSLSQ